MTVVAMIAARMGSMRFPGKVLAQLGGQPMLRWVVNAALNSSTDEVMVCTTTESQDDAIVDYFQKPYQYYPKTPIWRGPVDDVLRRFADCARDLDLNPDDLVVRLTGDCPFLDSRIIDEVITLHKRTKCVFAHNTDPATFPDGLDTEIVTVKALLEADAEATRLSDRNTVVQYIGRNRQRYPSRTLICPIPNLANERWVVDTEDDFNWAKAMVEALADYDTLPNLITMLDIIADKPELRHIGVRNERFYAAIASQQEKPV